MDLDQPSADVWIRALAWHAVIRTGAFDPATGMRAEGATPLVYVDKNPWGRHLDDPSVPRNAKEAEAFEDLLGRLGAGTIRLIYSTISFGEGMPRDGSLSASSVALRAVLNLKMGGLPLLAHDERADTSATAEYLYRTYKIAGQDAIHAAAALLEGAWYFVTGDDALRRRLEHLYRDWSLPIDAVTPVEVIRHIDRGAHIGN